MQQYLYNLVTDRYKGFIAGIFKFFLFVLSLIYGAAIRILAFVYRLKPYRLNCKVISVGNLTLGGTGKTPLVEFISRYLKENGRKVAVLSRGYKRKYRTMGDEPYMLSKRLNLPVIVDTDRIRAATQAIKDYGIDTVILDDGFQQWRLKKDLEIVTVDSTCAFGNNQMLPRGILREPLSSLKRADIFVLTKTNLVSDVRDIKYFLGQINPQALIVESIHSPSGFYEMGKEDTLLGLDILKGKTVTLVSGIADPSSFKNIILSLGVNIGLSFEFPDHHHYSKKDFNHIVKSCRDKKVDTIITTEKDAVRLCGPRATNPEPRILLLRIELKITENEQEFYDRLLGLYPV